MLQDSTNSWKAFFASCYVSESIFPAKSCQNAWRSGNLLARGQANMADEAKLCSPICSASQALVVWRVVRLWLSRRRIGSLLSTNASCRCCSFLCISSICWAYFSEVMVSLGFKVDQTSSRQPNSGLTFARCNFGFGKCFVTSRSIHWADHHQLSYKIHFSSHITIQLRNGLLLFCNQIYLRMYPSIKWQSSTMQNHNYFCTDLI